MMEGGGGLRLLRFPSEDRITGEKPDDSPCKSLGGSFAPLIQVCPGMGAQERLLSETHKRKSRSQDLIYWMASPHSAIGSGPGREQPAST